MPIPHLGRLAAPAAIAALLLGASCASSEPATQSPVASTTPATTASPGVTADGPVTVTNCNQDLALDAVAERIVATSNSANIGTLLRVGAADQLAAIALNSGNNAVMQELYGVDVSTVPRLTSPISLEAVVAAEPDLLIGSYSGLFAGSTGVTTEAANDKGIPTYVISDSCRQDPAAGTSSKLGTMDPWDAVRADISNYGALTGHSDEATEALNELNERLQALEAAPGADQAPRVLLFDSGTTELYTSGHNGPPQGILEAAGAENVFASEDTTWFKASWEAVATSAPDAIVVMDYRSDDPDEVAVKVETIRTQPALKDTEAVKQNRIIVLPLALFTSGYPNIEAAEQVRSGLENMGLLPETDIEGTLPESFTAVP